jgi:tetratricopeptide (TPR) repeat protein
MESMNAIADKSQPKPPDAVGLRGQLARAASSIVSILTLVICMSFAASATAAPFELTDTALNGEEFKKRFLASYGVNEAIEPKLTQADRPLYESIAPHLRSNPRQAIQIAQQSVTAESNASFDFLLGNLHYQIEDYAACEKHLLEAIRKFPSFRRAHRTLALVQIQRDQYAKAVAPLLKVIELGGGDAQSYGLLAYSYLTLEKYESSLAAYRMARMFKPDSPDFKRGQAHCLLMTHQPKAAIALFDELIADAPAETDFWLKQANAFLETGQKDKAIANLEIVADSGKANWSSLTLLADLYLDMNAHGLAVARYKRALNEFQPADPSAALRPLNYLVERRLYSEAREYLVIVRVKAGETFDARTLSKVNINEAQIELEIGDKQKGLATLQKELETDPLNGQSLLLVGEYYLSTDDHEKAELYFERALSVSDAQVEALIALGRLAVEQRKLSEAIEHLRKAQDIRPSSNVERFIAAIQKAIDAEK